MGEVTLSKGGQPASDPDFVREAGGFTFFGHGCVGSIQRSAYTVSVKTDVAHMLCIARRQLDVFLGAAGAGVGRDALVKALQRCPALEALSRVHTLVDEVGGVLDPMLKVLAVLGHGLHGSGRGGGTDRKGYRKEVETEVRDRLKVKEYICIGYSLQVIGTGCS